MRVRAVATVRYGHFCFVLAGGAIYTPKPRPPATSTLATDADEVPAKRRKVDDDVLDDATAASLLTAGDVFAPLHTRAAAVGALLQTVSAAAAQSTSVPGLTPERVMELVRAVRRERNEQVAAFERQLESVELHTDRFAQKVGEILGQDFS